MKNNNSLISIITVVYNGAEFIEKTILSVINQSYKNIEYIIIDGGSTDGTLDIIRKYEDKITYWISEPDRGIYDAMNKGIDIAKGNWINFMNSGDLFYSIDTLSLIAPYFAESKNILYGDTVLNYGVNRISEIKAAREFNYIKYNIPFCHQSVFVNLELIKEQKFDLNYRYSADYAMFLNVYKNKMYSYKKLAIPISIYDMNGVSNGVNALKEYCLIANRYNPYSLASVYHFLRLTCYITKSKIASKLPRALITILKKFVK